MPFTCFAYPLITGETQRPFPALMTIDYPYCRALAWVDALLKAEADIPAPAMKRLEEMRLNNSLGRQTLCALACEVNVVTPEIVSEDFIKVYLEPPSEKAIKAALDNPERFAQAMFLLFDMEQRLNQLSRTWPSSVADAMDRMDEIGKLMEELGILWKLVAEDHGRLPESQTELEALAKRLDTSAVLWLNLGIVLERNDRPQAALSACDKALELCGDQMELQRGRLVGAEIYYVRSLAQWQMAQPALAKADLALARRLLEKSAIKSSLMPKVLVFHGEIAASRKETDVMCADFLEACVYGECGRLAEARRGGYCIGIPVPRPGPLTPETLDSYMP